MDAPGRPREGGRGRQADLSPRVASLLEEVPDADPERPRHAHKAPELGAIETLSLVREDGLLGHVRALGELPA